MTGIPKYTREDLEKKTSENPFPNENVDPKVKESKQFGLKVANAIWYRSLYLESVNSTWQRIKENRDYAAAKQDLNQYKEMIDPEIKNSGDSSWINIDWSISSPAPKYVNILVGDMMNQELKIQFNAVDAKSKTRKEQARDNYIGKMIRKKDMLEFEKQTGVQLENQSDFTPRDMEELDMYMEMTFKESVEVAMEDIVDWTLYDNDWESIKPRVLHDLVENNKGAIRIYWDENNMIRIRYSDIGVLTTSYTNDPYYRDTEYKAEVWPITIRELRKLSKGQLTDKELFDIAKLSAEKMGNGAWPYPLGYNAYDWNTFNYTFDDFQVQVLDFLYYTTDIYTYEEKSRSDGRTYFSKKSLDYKKPENSRYNVDVIQKKSEQAYTGLWVVGTEYIVYGRDKNITRPKSADKFAPKLIDKWIVIEPNKRYGASNSLIDLIKPNLDMIQLLTLKMRNFVAEAVPPGMQIDINTLSGITTDGEESWHPLKLIKLYKQRGIILYDGMDQNGDPINRRPIEFMQNGIQDGLRPFIEAIANELMQIASITGINESRDGSRPDKDALVGIQKMALLASNNATRELYNAFNKGILERTGRVISRMIQDKIHFSGNIDEYKAVIGREAVKSIEFIPSDMALADFGIKIEALPTGEEIQDLANAIDISVKSGEIRYEDGLEIKRMNPKKAIKYLKWRKKVYQEEAMQEMAQKEQMTMEREQQAAINAAEAERIRQQAIAEKEIAVINAKSQSDIELEKLKHANKVKEIQWETYGKLQEIEKAADENLDESKSDNPMSPEPKVFPDVKNMG